MVFKYAADRLPVTFICALTVLDFALYFAVDSGWLLLGYWLLMLIPKGIAGAWSHHHQHCPTFHSPVLNRLLEQCHALQSGLSTHFWTLHHVLGHHVNYLDQTKDESRWRRADGTKMSMLEYTVWLTLTAYPRAFAVGRRYPRLQRTFLFFGGVTLALVAVLIWHRPLQGVLVFAVPMISSVLFTSWVTYDHHAGLESGGDPFHASHNIMNRWFNRLTGNLGYHTAHHKSGGLHWSRLPAFHARIADRIPAHLFQSSTFDTLLPDA